jgi:hypothetical protein
MLTGQNRNPAQSAAARQLADGRRNHLPSPRGEEVRGEHRNIGI